MTELTYQSPAWDNPLKYLVNGLLVVAAKIGRVPPLDGSDKRIIAKTLERAAGGTTTTTAGCSARDLFGDPLLC